MDVLRTPDERFRHLPDWPHEPRYVEVDGLRIHYVDAGPPAAPPVLLLHGEPTWSFLYRRVIAQVAAAGYRAVAPDLVGFGRSDKPAAVEDHSYAAHVAWIGGVVTALDLQAVTLVGQDWGGLVGLRLLAGDPDRFAGVVAANTGLPTGDHPMPDVWWEFRNWIDRADELPIGFLVNAGCLTDLAPEVLAAYDAPFPDESYKAGPRALPLLVPTTPDDPASEANRAAWTTLASWKRPFLCAFSDSDPITGPMAPVFRDVVPGARTFEHHTIANAGHFLQEDAGAELGDVIARATARIHTPVHRG